MNALDIAVIVVLTYFLIRGVFRGLVKEVVGVLGLFVAFWVASVYWEMGAAQLAPITEKDSYRGVLSFIIIYLIIYFLISLLSIFVDKVVKLAITPLISSVLGGALGLMKGAALTVILLTVVMGFLSVNEPFFQNSYAWERAASLTGEVRSWLPDRVGAFIADRQRAVGGSLRPAPATPAPSPRAGDRPREPLTPPSDYRSLMNIVRDNPFEISPAWMGTIDSLDRPEALTPEMLAAFIREHPNLFNRAPATAPGAQPNAQPSAPPWGRPAVEGD
ncbi:MAG: CvpA family protein [Deltaproteobacteria bacterium]|jgi:membrane protein required for colicin V production|nr:CvpA family protein [Deltaproteobacteria bacterium]